MLSRRHAPVRCRSTCHLQSDGTRRACAIAGNIIAHEGLFRLSIVCYLSYCAGLVVLLTALYVILKPVNRGLALIGAFWRLIFALVWILISLNLFTGLRLLSGTDYLRVFEAERLQALARLYLSGFDAYYVGLLFYALASTVCANDGLPSTGAVELESFLPFLAATA